MDGMSQPVIEAIYVGRPRVLCDEQGEWTSAIARHAAPGPLSVGADGLPEDQVANTVAHGGPDRALLAYGAGHYAAFAAELGRVLPTPGFGENLRVVGFDEANVAIGDVWQVGDLRLQVTMPRAPCGKIGRHVGVADMLERVTATVRVGWFLRVLTPGPIAPGQPITVVERPNPDWTVERVFRANRALRARDGAAHDENRAVTGLPGLAGQWLAETDRLLNALGRQLG